MSSQADTVALACQAGLPARPTGKRADRQRFQWSSLALLGPSLILLAVLFVIPVIYAFYLGFTNLELVGPNSVTWLRILVGGIVVVAWMMPAITAGMTWYASTTAAGTFGTLLGMPNSDFLHHEPMLIVTLANVWSQTGFAMLVLGAALRNIPHEVLEAADMEDASRWQRFRLITLPMLRPTIVTTVLLITLISLANFALIYVMTQGGPGNSTNILPLYSYQQAFEFNNLAYGAIIGNVMVLVCAIFGVIYVRASRVRT